MQVLVAEDNPIFQVILEALLREWGYDVILVSKGEDAWKILQREDGPQLAILDWFMPGMTGMEVCRRVRASVTGRYVYMLLLTARSHSGDVVSGMEAGADDYLTKPFNAQELRVRLFAGRRVLNVLGRSQQESCARPACQ
jgi:DNA-binding response OmpR family regulator